MTDPHLPSLRTRRRLASTAPLAAIASFGILLLAGGAAVAQPYEPVGDDSAITVTGEVPAVIEGFPEGPELEGYISARTRSQIRVTGEDGTTTAVAISEATQVRARGGFLGLGRTSLAADALLNGVPVSVETVEWGGGLVASRVVMRDEDLRTASMIRNGTAQRFGENELAIQENAAATEALRGRFGDIDQYELRGTANVFFDSGRWQLTEQGAAELCALASQANATENALLLVVGYTDSVGDEDYNQQLSERRAGRVVNHLQQRCGWAPYRMLTPTGMAESDPAADNTTASGRAQNRRVAVNILVSKAVAGL